MEYVTRIQGQEKLIRAFEELQGRKTPVRFHVMGREYERLTIVTGVESREGRVFVLVDLPNRFHSDVPDGVGERVHLEYADKDKILHSCRTEISRVDGDDLWLVLPDSLDRIQRRRHFRVEPPTGTRVVFSLQGRNIDSPVLNLSMGGGLLISPAGEEKDSGLPLALKAGMVLYDLLLVGAMEGEKLEVKIKSAEVIRVTKVSETKRLSFAVQFSGLGREGATLLERFIYYSQRRLLRKRSLLLTET